MRASSIPDIVEPCSAPPRKKRRLDCPPTASTTPPLAFNRAADCHSQNAVCYGMIDVLQVQSHTDSTALKTIGAVPVTVHRDRTLRLQNDNANVGSLDKDVFDTLEKLALEGIEFQFSVAPNEGNTAQRKRSRSLEVIFYGPKHVADVFGSFMEECGYCLQDPSDCDRNVPYLNPHRLSSQFGNLPMTYDIQHSRRGKIETWNKASVDALANFQTSERLALAETPSALATKLNLHQKQALTFFRRREMGLGPSALDYSVWQRSGSNHAAVFFNIVTDQEQSSMPPVWRGGILADEMGLGKTLSMIALIASDKDISINVKDATSGIRSTAEAHTTLVIVPKTVLPAWEMQLNLHVAPGKLKWMKHHGRSRRLGAASGAHAWDIVLTTYQTVESEYRQSKTEKGVLFSTHWDRIVLDEAHIVRNWKSSTARGIASLSATYRWAVSGTPIQNGLMDLLGLFKVLHFEPYNDTKVFDEDIAGLTRNKTLDDSIERLKRLLSCVMIRRTKATVTTLLPPRSEQIIRLSFSPQEKEYYESIEQPAAKILEDEWNEAQPSGSVWLSVLQQIHSLRLVCNLGTSAALSRSSLAVSVLSNDNTASQMLNERLLMGDGSCQHCLTIFDLSPQSLQVEDENSGRAYYSTCFKLFCDSCATMFNFVTPEPCDCEGTDIDCNLQPIPLRKLTPASTPQNRSASPSSDNGASMYISTKLQALLSDLKWHSDEKSVVFSFWTSSLDMVERALQHGSVAYVRIDGKVSSSARVRILEQFRNDPSIRVMLITTSCGAVGIDLTAASRAYMLEPQWNPTVEEQAMARIHRIGQTRAVTAIRFIMEDSIEEHIMDVVQDRKKLLVSRLLPALK